MNLKRNILSSVLMVFALVPPLLAQAQRMSLEEALRIAIEHNRNVASAVLDVRRAEASVKAAQTQRLPSFALSADVGEPLTRPYLDLAKGVLGTVNGTPFPEQLVRLSTARTPSAFVFGQALEPLSRQYQIGLEIKSLNLGREIGSERLRATKQEIRTLVRSLYAQILDDTDAVQAAKADVALYTELERVTKIYVTEGTVLHSDLLQVQAKLLHARHDQTTAENTLTSAKEQFNLVLGRPVETEFDVNSDTELRMEFPTRQEAIATALRLRPDLKEAQLQVDRADLDRRAKKAEYIPDISLAATYVNLSGSGLPIGGGGYAEVGAQLKWEPFDWGRKHHELAEKADVVRQARIAVTERQERARIEVSSALRDALAAQQLLESVALDEQAAEESLRVVQAKYAQRAALLDEVLKMQNARAQARAQVSHVRAMIRSDAASLSKAMGEDL